MVRRLPLLIVPLLVALTTGVLLHLIAPIYAGLVPYDYDPAYIYLFNGLGIVEGHVPRHVDHPGTPLQVLIGLIVFAAHAVMRLTGATASDIGASVMAAPEAYLAVVSAVTLALNVFAIFYLGLRVLRATARIELALASQAGLLLLGALMPHMGYVSAEALVIFAAVMTAACLADLLLRETPLDRPETRAAIIGSAFFIALGLTTKITFLPLLLLPFLFRTRRDIVLCFALVAAFAAVMLLPIVPELPRVMAWLASILTHRGRYGAGEQGFINIAAFPDRLYQLVAANGFLFATAALLAIAGRVALARRRPDADERSALRTVAIFLGIAALQLVMTLKHFGLHYMLPTFCVYSIAFVYALTRLMPRGRAKHVRSLAGLTFGAALIIGGAQFLGTYQASRAEAQVRDTAMAEIERTLARYPDALVVGSFRSRERHFALRYALEFVAPELAAQLATFQPNALSYNRWEEKLMIPGGTKRELAYLNEVTASGRTVLFVMPGDLDLPNLAGERLLQIPGRETVFHVTRINPKP
jgi:hypothetical protein